jgi:SAM-dependent methyltransferase
VRSEFDERFQLDTERIEEIGSLDIDSPNAKYAVRYQPSPPNVLGNLLPRLGICYRDFAFIDFGSGKGRVLLIASEFGFSKVIGIEFSPELVKAAHENITAFERLGSKKSDIEVILGDVCEYEIPAMRLVCYFYNPFQRPVMAHVVNKLTASIQAHRRDVYVIYVHPEHRNLFDKSEWECLVDDPAFVVYNRVKACP